MTQILLKPIFKEAWTKVAGTKETFFILFLALGLTQLVIMGIDAYLNPYLSHANGMMLLINFMLIIIFCMPLLTGLFMMGVKRARDQEIHYKQGLMYFKKIGPLFLTSLLVSFTSWLAGLIFSFLSGALLRLLLSNSTTAFMHLNTGIVEIFSFASFSLLPFSLIYVADQNQNPWQAYKNSIRTVLVYFKPVILAFIVCFLSNLIVIIPPCIGFIWSLPFSQIVIGILYREITQANKIN